MPTCTDLRCKSDTCRSFLEPEFADQFFSDFYYFNCWFPVTWCFCCSSGFSWHFSTTEPCCPAHALGSDWLFEIGAEALYECNKELCGQEEPGCFLKSDFSQTVTFRELLQVLFLCHRNTLKAALIMLSNINDMLISLFFWGHFFAFPTTWIPSVLFPTFSLPVHQFRWEFVDLCVTEIPPGD